MESSTDKTDLQMLELFSDANGLPRIKSFEESPLSRLELISLTTDITLALKDKVFFLENNSTEVVFGSNDSYFWFTLFLLEKLSKLKNSEQKGFFILLIQTIIGDLVNDERYFREKNGKIRYFSTIHEMVALIEIFTKHISKASSKTLNSIYNENNIFDAFFKKFYSAAGLDSFYGTTLSSKYLVFMGAMAFDQKLVYRDYSIETLQTIFGFTINSKQTNRNTFKTVPFHS